MDLRLRHLAFDVRQRGHRRVELDACLALPLSVRAVAEGALLFVEFPARLEVLLGGRERIPDVALLLPGLPQKQVGQKGFDSARRLIRAPVFSQKRSDRKCKYYCNQSKPQPGV